MFRRFLLAAVLSTLMNAGALAADLASARKLPRPNHVVIVMEENRPYSGIIGNMAAQYINALANRGALFSQSYAITHPSQPNYLALFAGSTLSVRDDRCLNPLTGENLASVLLRAGLTFGIYSESMRSVGFTGCEHGHYQRKHNPAVNWQGVNVPPAANMPFTSFPSDYSKLPTLSIVVPNQENDMHNGDEPQAIIQGDNWLRAHLDGYVQWAQRQNGLLIVTWDEDDDRAGNRIPTIFVGPMVRKGVYAQRIDHYGVLRTILDMYGLPPLGHSAKAQPIDYVWARETAPVKVGK